MASHAPQQGISPKQLAIGAAAVILIVVALVLVYKTWASTQVQVVRHINLPPGSSEKMQAMKQKGEVPDEGASDNINPGAMQHR